ncbi:hypothetical protein N7462_003085 [Penicillium macrosclerotiorum]|uniref:uncharacterized protein n=1 Tax=Penicillium macrosclerotiorum TaxID=303699 RepID=UPI00254956FD|nr:uncharacterized protein N7462_003085 [Penicillium macrosclerotiorum]KAJ5688693.1 hypothetical protein N7462_003085 [Penicillium macrosclerotiorum]
MFGSILSWFQPAQQPATESKWDANTVTMQQPNSPSAPTMNQNDSEQAASPESMNVNMRGGFMPGEPDDDWWVYSASTFSLLRDL